ncbi:unnamed protein product [Microthlaspi erraticum]|uniref:Uncharacterized protein n=1 Tax=Microthlaspi erraticum TaxID=1685480 RepID=A0A6D2K5Z4_9BRAS|nr:unnamed protein product [Microthlaspi erraticum]
MVQTLTLQSRREIEHERPKARTEQTQEDPVFGNKAKDNGKAKEDNPSSDEELQVDEATLKEMRRQEGNYFT